MVLPEYFETSIPAGPLSLSNPGPAVGQALNGILQRQQFRLTGKAIASVVMMDAFELISQSQDDDRTGRVRRQLTASVVNIFVLEGLKTHRVHLFNKGLKSRTVHDASLQSALFGEMRTLEEHASVTDKGKPIDRAFLMAGRPFQVDHRVHGHKEVFTHELVRSETRRGRGTLIQGGGKNKEACQKLEFRGP